MILLDSSGDEQPAPTATYTQAFVDLTDTRVFVFMLLAYRFDGGIRFHIEHSPGHNHPILWLSDFGSREGWETRRAQLCELAKGRGLTATEV